MNLRNSIAGCPYSSAQRKSWGVNVMKVVRLPEMKNRQPATLKKTTSFKSTAIPSASRVRGVRADPFGLLYSCTQLLHFLCPPTLHSWLVVDPWEVTRRRIMDYMSVLEHAKEVCHETFPGFAGDITILYMCQASQVINAITHSSRLHQPLFMRPAFTRGKLLNTRNFPQSTHLLCTTDTPPESSDAASRGVRRNYSVPSVRERETPQGAKSKLPQYRDCSGGFGHSECGAGKDIVHHGEK